MEINLAIIRNLQLSLRTLQEDYIHLQAKLRLNSVFEIRKVIIISYTTSFDSYNALRADFNYYKCCHVPILTLVTTKLFLLVLVVLLQNIFNGLILEGYSIGKKFFTSVRGRFEKI